MASPEPSVSDDTPNSPVTEEILGEVANVVVKDEQYYMQFVTLLVEDTLFMVPKHLFTRSCNFFSWMSDEDVETKSHELEGVSKTDFQALLKLIYPLNLPLEPVLSESEWISVLKLSSLWTMIDLRERAIDSLRSLESIQKVLLARTYGISTWLHSGYVDLASRNAALSIEDAHSLGLETAVKLIDIRERRYSSHTAGHGGQSTTGKSIVDAEFSGKIQDVQTVNSGDIADMLLWAKAVGNAQSLRLAYIDFVERSTAITLEEALKLGDETTINISQAREKLQNSLGRLIWSLESVSQELKVYDAFAEEFATIANVGALYARAPDLNQETQTTVPVRDHLLGDIDKPVRTMSEIASSEKLLNLPDGRTLAYEDGGNLSSSIVVLFLTGTLSVGVVTRLSPPLEAKGVHYIAPTLPGYGNTSPASPNLPFHTTIAQDMSALLAHLHPDTSNLELYISGGSLGTVPTQMLYGASFEAFPYGRYIRGMLLLGAFPPFIRDKEFDYTQSMNMRDYILVGPVSRFIPFHLLQRLAKSVIKSKLATQESAEAFLRELLFDKMGEQEKEVYRAWREKLGYDEDRLPREMAQNNLRSVAKSWEGFLGGPDTLHSDWGWGVPLGSLDEAHTVGRKVLIVAATEDDMTTIEWARYLASKYSNSRLKTFPGGHISVLFRMDEIWEEFFAE